ncbi:MAG TPA: Gfo/Idh/MocA family oxidoreductase [Terriglobia bacterium]|nr:Gfo/Idh/MocA family oxidoreductase [Terriglobia bacterium]
MSSISSNPISRRQFIERTVAGATAAGVTLAARPARPMSSPNETITMGVIGAGIRGLENMRSILAVGGHVAMVCDLYDGHFRRAREFQANTPVTRDYQEVLDRKDIDAVLIATSDHWHAPIAIAAMRAGKDVYCEKPMTHTIPEALEMVKVSKETGRVVQVGSQSLSMQSTHKGKEWVDSGAIGNVFMVQCEIYRPDPVGAWKYPVPADASPQTIDWERYLGNTPRRPFDAARFFQFRNWWDYGTGIAGDEYVHLLSRVHYLMNIQYPVSGVASGGIYKWTGDRDVPDIHNTLYDYGKFQVVVMANLVSNFEGGEIVRFMGDKGTVELTEESATLMPYDEEWSFDYPLDSWPKDTRDVFMAAHKNDPTADIGTYRHQPHRKRQTFKQTAEGTEDHLRNFFQAIKSRQQPIENVDFGCGTAVACHMANISYHEKQRLFWDAEKGELTGEKGPVDMYWPGPKSA